MKATAIIRLHLTTEGEITREQLGAAMNYWRDRTSSVVSSENVEGTFTYAVLIDMKPIDIRIHRNEILDS